MLNTIEERIMVNPINDLIKPKAMESERVAKTNADEAPSFIETLTSMDSVNISSESKQLEALKASLKDVPEINEARVLYFKAEIEAGTYQIRSDKIAQNMLNNVEMA